MGIQMGWVQLSSLVGLKRHGTAYIICPKGKARTFKPRVPSVPKTKLGHLVFVRHGVIILRKLYTWVGFNYPPWLDPKDMDGMGHWSQR